MGIIVCHHSNDIAQKPTITLEAEKLLYSDELSEILIPHRKMAWLLEWIRSMFTIRFSVDDLSPLELDKLCGVIENCMKELRGEYDVVDTPKSR